MILSEESKAKRVMSVLADAKSAAKEYRRLTGRPLGITGEIAEYEAARLLHLTLAPAREAGFDASETIDGAKIRYQIKGRCIHDRTKRGHRVGAIKLDHAWDAVLLVLLDVKYEAIEIHQAGRNQLEAFIKSSESGANKRGAIGVSKLKSLSTVRWRPVPSGAV